MEYASWKLYPNLRRNSKTGAKNTEFRVELFIDLEEDHCRTEIRRERAVTGASYNDGVKSRITIRK